MTSTLLDQALVAHRDGRLDEAERLYRSILRQDAKNADVLALLGILLGAKGQHDESLTLIEQAYALDSDAPLFKFYLANAAAEGGDSLRAVALLQETVTVQPDFAAAWLSLCKYALNTEEKETAVAAGQQATSQMSQNAEAWFYFGLALNRAGKNQEALQAYETANQIDPQLPEVLDNIGLTHELLEQPEKAIAAFHRLLAISGQAVSDEELRTLPEQALGKWHYHLSLLELLLGDYRRGFARYRSRYQALSYRKRPGYFQPIWRGENLKGKTILVYEEQGLGDCLMLCRYLPLLKAQGGSVKFMVPAALVPLFSGWNGIDEIFMRGSDPGAFDYQASIFDLPFAFDTTMETVPAVVPYLPVHGVKADHQLADDGFKVGVVWAGAPAFGTDALRSVPLEKFSTLFAIPHIKFYSMNRDMRLGDAEILTQYKIMDLAPRLQDFSDTAQFVSQLDLVIACDTSMAHLAGGMGKPVWVLLPFAPDWRWMKQRTDNIWYPTASLFRQKRDGDWEEVMSRVGEALTQKAGLFK